MEKFCHGQGYEESENADKKTLPAIIERTVLPNIQGKYLISRAKKGPDLKYVICPS